MAACLMRVENGDKTFVIRTCMAEERNSYYSENVCKKLVYIVYDLIPSNWLVTVGSKLAIVFYMGNFAY